MMLDIEGRPESIYRQLTLSHWGRAEHIFVEGGGKQIAAACQSHYLGAPPLDRPLRWQANSAKPTRVAGIYQVVARKVAIAVATKAKDFFAKFPSIAISKNTTVQSS